MRTSGPLVGGAKSAIAGTALQLTATSVQLNSGIYLTALAGNTAPVYIGITGVTTSTGFLLAAGGTSPLIPVSDPSTVYVISTGGSQEVRWIGA